MWVNWSWLFHYQSLRTLMFCPRQVVISEKECMGFRSIYFLLRTSYFSTLFLRSCVFLYLLAPLEVSKAALILCTVLTETPQIPPLSFSTYTTSQWFVLFSCEKYFIWKHSDHVSIVSSFMLARNWSTLPFRFLYVILIATIVWTHYCNAKPTHWIWTRAFRIRLVK